MEKVIAVRKIKNHQSHHVVVLMTAWKSFTTAQEKLLRMQFGAGKLNEASQQVHHTPLPKKSLLKPWKIYFLYLTQALQLSQEETESAILLQKWFCSNCCTVWFNHRWWRCLQTNKEKVLQIRGLTVWIFKSSWWWSGKTWCWESG